MNYVVYLMLKLYEKFSKNKKEETIKEPLVIKEDKKKNQEKKLDEQETFKEESSSLKAKKEEFDKIKAQDCIYAKTPDFCSDDLSHLIRPFLIVGRSENELYALYKTSQEKYKDNPRYCEYHSSTSSKNSYTKCDKLYTLTIDDFDSFLSEISVGVYRKIIDTYIRYCNEYEKIDFDALKYNVRKGSILYKDKELYVVLDATVKKCTIARLIEDKNASLWIYLKGKKHKVDESSIEEIVLDLNKYRIIGDVPKEILPMVRNIDISPYEFADVISISSKKEKGIYMTSIDDYIYYVNFSSLELFSGISKVKKNNVSGKVRNLTNDELERLVMKVEKPLKEDRYPIYKGVKNNILGSILNLKK